MARIPGQGADPSKRLHMGVLKIWAIPKERHAIAWIRPFSLHEFARKLRKSVSDARTPSRAGVMAEAVCGAWQTTKSGASV